MKKKKKCRNLSKCSEVFDRKDGVVIGVNNCSKLLKSLEIKEFMKKCNFLFGKVMQNPELCKELLQRILPDLRIDHVEYPELQKSINVDMNARSVRLDVYVKDDKEVVYDIEMQVSDTKELPKRSRYYQSMLDLQFLNKGRFYDELKRSYVIFICPFDLYGNGRHIYTFENICKEDSSILMGDEAVKIFLNAKGTLNDVSDGKRFLIMWLERIQKMLM